jgi:hypothetical protein
MVGHGSSLSVQIFLIFKIIHQLLLGAVGLPLFIEKGRRKSGNCGAPEKKRRGWMVFYLFQTAEKSMEHCRPGQ